MKKESKEDRIKWHIEALRRHFEWHIAGILREIEERKEDEDKFTKNPDVS